MANQNRHLTTEELSAFLDGQLSSVEKIYTDAHLKTCERCRQTLADLRQTVSLLQALPQPPLPRSFTLPTQEASIASPLEQLQRTYVVPTTKKSQGWPQHIRTTIRTMSTLAAVIGLFFLLSALPGTTSFSNKSETAGSSSSRYEANKSASQGTDTQNTPNIQPENQPAKTPSNTGTNGATEAGKDGTAVPQVQPTPTGGVVMEPLHPQTPVPPLTPPIWDLNTATGRALLGLALLILGIIGFLLLAAQQRFRQGT